MSDDATKTCAHCAETIRAAARICPFCQMRLDRGSGYAAAVGPLVSAFGLMGVTGFALWLLAPEQELNGRDFARHRSELGVVRVALDRAKVRNDWWVSGFVTNQGARPWRVQELEIRFVDPQGRLLDVAHPNVTESFVVLPAQEHAFRLPLGARDWTNDTTLPQVRVQVATDGRFPAPD